MSLLYKKLQQAQPAPVTIHPANPRVKAMFKWALWYQCFKYFWQVLNIISSLIYFWQVWNMFLEFQLWHGLYGAGTVWVQYWVNGGLRGNHSRMVSSLCLIQLHNSSQVFVLISDFFSNLCTFLKLSVDRKDTWGHSEVCPVYYTLEELCNGLHFSQHKL